LHRIAQKGQETAVAVQSLDAGPPAFSRAEVERGRNARPARPPPPRAAAKTRVLVDACWVNNGGNEAQSQSQASENTGPRRRMLRTRSWVDNGGKTARTARTQQAAASAGSRMSHVSQSLSISE